MKYINIINGLAAATLLATCHLSLASSPVNLDVSKANVIAYHDSGEYDKDIASVNAKALAYLEKRVANRTPNEKLALILDIDETSLSNYPDMVRYSFGGTLPQIIAAEDKGTDRAIASTLALFQYAKAHDVAVFLITGRFKSSRATTIRNLEKAGYHDFDGLIMKPNNYHGSPAPYKTAIRQSIAAKGYTIVVNVGDQESDLAGGYAEKTFKLPNPYYLLP